MSLNREQRYSGCLSVLQTTQHPPFDSELVTKEATLLFGVVSVLCGRLLV